MSATLSIQDVVAEIQAKIAHLRSQVETHTRQEAFHREQKERFAAELDEVSRHFEEFERSAGVVLAIAGQSRRQGPRQGDGPDLGGKPMLSKLISTVLADKRGEETFNATQLAREIDRRFGQRLGRRVDPRSVASQLRRWHQRGKLHLVQPGRAHHEAVYSRGRGEG